jgi:hypothetical protein
MGEGKVNMKEEEHLLSNAFTALLVIATIAVAVVLFWELVWLNVVPAVIHGYWIFAVVLGAVWAVITIVWVGLMETFISRKRRKQWTRAMKRAAR